MASMYRILFRPLMGLVAVSLFFAAGCSHDLDAVAKPGQKDIGPADDALADVSQDLPLPDGPVPDTSVLDMPLVDLPVQDAALDQTGPDLPIQDQQITVDQNVVDQTVVDQQIVVDQTVVDQAVVDQAVVDQAVPDQMVPDQMVLDQAPPLDQQLTPDQTVCAKVGDACDDGVACTHTDKCTAVGVCAGTAYSCNDTISCTTDICLGKPYSQGGCSNVLTPGYCRISGTCYADGTSGGGCKMCDSKISPTTWAPAKGQNCLLTLTGNSNGHTDGTLAVAQFNSPTGVAVDKAGVIYVADWKNQRIRKIEKGMVSTLAGDGTQGTVNATGILARFYEPYDVDVDSSGTVYVAQTGASSAGQQAFIRKITKAGVVSTYAGGGSGALQNGSAFAWRFWKPKGIAVGLQGQVYATDTMHQLITEITGNQIKLLAGTLTSKGDDGLKGTTDSALLQSRFQYPAGLAIAPGGVVYVADTGNGLLRKVVLGSNVTTVATGIADITDVAVDMSNGRVYVAQGQINTTTPGHNIYEIDPINKTKKKLAGLSSKGFANGPGITATLNDPVGLAVDANGYLLIADRGNSMIRVLNPN